MSTAASSDSPYHPDHPEEVIAGYTSIPDEGPLDQPGPDEVIPPPEAQASPTTSRVQVDLPRVILGCATLGYGIYTKSENVLSDMPLRVVRLALRGGITAFDTSPWYHPSEIILGNCLEALRSEFPRESYKIITKAGKFGVSAAGHVYDADVIKRSVERSLRRLKTDYLDAVYLHDPEFISSPPRCASGNHLDALSPSHASKYGLEPPHVPRGPGDEAVLSTYGALLELKKAGKIRAIGIAGFPLPVLMRLGLLIAHAYPSHPIDILQTYGHQSLQNPSLTDGWLEAFTKPIGQGGPGVGRVISAAPLGMGILTTSGPPTWHPALPQLGPVMQRVNALCLERGVKVEDVACDFGYRRFNLPDGQFVPVVIGCKSLDEVHMSLKSYRRAQLAAEGKGDPRSAAIEKEIIELFKKEGVLGWTWQNIEGEP